jgi:hypothetical protein
VDAALGRDGKCRTEAARRKRFVAGGVFATTILALIPEQPDLTLVETVAELRKRKIRTCRSSLWRLLDRHNITLKKACRLPNDSEQTWHEHADVGYESKVCLISPRLVFIDETAVSTNLVRLRGRAPRGVRVIGIVPLGAWETITFVAALRHNKMTAPMVIEGAMTGEVLLAYVKQCLVPTLRRNDIVVMDNCRVHPAPAIREAIERAPATLRYRRNILLTSIRLSCLTVNSRNSSARLPRELFRASREQFARSSHSSALTNVPIISSVLGMLQYDRNPP